MDTWAGLVPSENSEGESAPPFSDGSGNPKHSLACGHFGPLSVPMFTLSSLFLCVSFSSSIFYADAGHWV